MRIGDIELLALQDGEIRRPPTQSYPSTTDADWEPHKRWLTHDGLLEMPIGCFLVRTADRVVLIDAGLGTATPPGMTGGRLIDELASYGTKPEDITDVIFTHLHFDHVGWATQQGTVMFPNATYRCHAHDWSYFVEDGDGGAARKLSPLMGQLEIFDAQTTLAPGLDAVPTPGHTPGHIALVVSSGTDRAMLLGDATHCPVELYEAEWDGLADVDPELAKRTRIAMYKELESSGTLATAAHFPGLQFGRVLRAEGRAQWVVA